MTISKETKNRIAREALREYPANRYMSDDLFFTRQAQQESYIAGAEAWAERAQPLLDHLTKIRDHLPENDVIRIRLTEVLTAYSGK